MTEAPDFPPDPDTSEIDPRIAEVRVTMERFLRSDERFKALERGHETMQATLDALVQEQRSARIAAEREATARELVAEEAARARQEAADARKEEAERQRDAAQLAQASSEARFAKWQKLGGYLIGFLGLGAAIAQKMFAIFGVD